MTRPLAPLVPSVTSLSWPKRKLLEERRPRSRPRTSRAWVYTQSDDARRACLARRRTRHTGTVTTATATVVERTGPGILAALHKHAAPQEGAQFEAELRDALARAGTDLDVARVDEVITRWHTRACILANPLTGEEQTLLRRARTGDFTGLRVRDENGGWTTL